MRSLSKKILKELTKSRYMPRKPNSSLVDLEKAQRKMKRNLILSKFNTLKFKRNTCKSFKSLNPISKK